MVCFNATDLWDDKKMSLKRRAVSTAQRPATHTEAKPASAALQWGKRETPLPQTQ